MPRVEECFTSLVLKLLAAESTGRLRQLLTRLICGLAAEYWLESQCFENFFTAQLGALSTQNQPVTRLLITEILVSIKMLVASTESGSIDDEVVDQGSTGAQA